ncbi:hypothetical protein SLE2022_032930 [Rubroshorea leprosula]
MAEDKEISDTEKKESDVVKKKRKGGGFFSRIWSRLHGDDLEKRLQNISKEEDAVLARMKRRSVSWRRNSRNLIAFSVVFELIAVGYAIMTTRSADMDWKMKAFRILPVFLLPGLSAAAYSAFVSFTRLCDRRDQKTLERLRAERQAKIDELKEKTNYYTTQQLIQRYDPDPAAKAAAATVLASKLGADSGLKVHLEGESNPNVSTGKSSDVEVTQSSGLRNRTQMHKRSSSVGSASLPPSTHHSNEETPHSSNNESPQAPEYNQVVVNHFNPEGSGMSGGGWLARIAALLVGEDPTQSFALICGNCHRHNGLVRKEDFPYITYFCPHCHALNRPKQLEENVSCSSSPKLDSLKAGENVGVADKPSGGTSDSALTNNSPVSSSPEIEEVSQRVPSGNQGS